MIDANATEVQIDTDPHETMIGAGGHDRAAEVRVGEGDAAPARNIRHTVARNHLPLHGAEMVKDNTRDLIEVMVPDTVAGARTT